MATQANRRASVSTSLGEDVLLFYKLHAREELGRLFEFQVDMLSEDGEIALQDLLGTVLTVTYTYGNDQKRHFSGHITSFRQFGKHGNLHQYQAVVQPLLWFSTRVANSRFFSGDDAPTVVAGILGDYGVTVSDKKTGSYRKRDYCVQYRETDFNFISRLMEEEGCYYYYEHADGAHTMVLADDVSSLPDLPEFAEIPFYPPGDWRDVPHIWELSLRKSVQSAIASHTDYDFKAPANNLLVQTTLSPEHGEQNDLKIFDYPGYFVDDLGGVAASGEHLTKMRAEEYQAQYELAQGTGDVAAISPGFLFTLSGHDHAGHNRKYLVVQAIHTLQSNEYVSLGGESETEYKCSFTLQDASRPFRTRRTAPKPVVQGPQTGVVIGSEGDDTAGKIDVDSFGRVRVKLHWYNTDDNKASCWVRVSQAWAGPQWGTIHIPRIGHEVIVDFLEGDPDQPIITGRVYNALKMPIYPLADEMLTSGLKSRSYMQEEGYNEYVFIDTAGEELIREHGQFDKDSTIENDLREHVLHDRSRDVANNETIEIGKNRVETVGDNQTTTIGKNFTEEVGKDRSRSVADHETVSVGKDRSHTIGANETIDVGKDQNISIGAAQSLTVGKAQTNSIGDARSTTVGKGDTLDVAKALGITAGDQITLTCGSAKIMLKKNGDIAIEGAKIMIKGGSSITMKSSKIVQN